MSYILDALKKAEQERDLGRVPRLASMQEAAPRRSRALIGVMAGVLLVNAAALVWWLRSGPPASTPVQQLPAPAVAPATVATPVPASTAPVKPVVVAQASPPQRIAAVAKPVPASPAVRTIVQAESPAPVRKPAATKPEPVVEQPAMPVAKPAVPLLRDLPEEYRAAVPALSLDVHVYAAQPAQRFVLINMKKCREGEQLAEGPRLEEITPDGVVLSYRGEHFRIARP